MIRGLAASHPSRTHLGTAGGDRQLACVLAGVSCLALLRQLGPWMRRRQLTLSGSDGRLLAAADTCLQGQPGPWAGRTA
jgi:hypothetical protein